MALSLFIKISNNTLKGQVANFGIFSKKVDLKKCYQILGIQENSDQEQIRAAYLSLVKRFHPDSGTEEANIKKFQEIDKAFRLLINKKSKERWDVEEGVLVEDHPDIKHTAPQHRQYLNYEGVGFGNPFQREKQYGKVRAAQAAKNVYEHHIAKATADEKSLINKDQIFETWEKVPLDHKIKTKHGFDRLVEDLIQESIARGEFKNLKNSGKPLPTHQNINPYVDFVTHKINEVLIENGFTPEWITLQKEIREEAAKLRIDLLTERKHFGPYPLSVEENIVWSEKVYRYKNNTEAINKKITKFNLLVPILSKQMLHVCLENEAQKAMVNGKSTEDILDYEVYSKNVGCDGGTNNNLNASEPPVPPRRRAAEASVDGPLQSAAPLRLLHPEEGAEAGPHLDRHTRAARQSRPISFALRAVSVAFGPSSRLSRFWSFEPSQSLLVLRAVQI